MNKSSGNIMVLLIGGVLLIFTAYRTTHLIQSTLPPEAAIIGYAALAGLDGALVGWSIFKMYSARGDKQNAIATYMICLQLAGIAGTLLGDTLTVSAPDLAMSQLVGQIMLWAVPVIIATNVAATVAVHIADPTQQIRTAKRELQDELERQVAEHLRTNAAQIAARVTPAAAEQRADELLAEFMRGNHKPVAVPAAPEPVAAGSGANGHGAGKAVTRMTAAQRAARQAEGDADPLP